MAVIRVNGVAVFWEVARILGVTDSSTRVAYCGAAIVVRRLFRADTGATIPCDSAVAKKLAENPKKMGMTRHLAIKWHFTRHHVQKGVLLWLIASLKV